MFFVKLSTKSMVNSKLRRNKSQVRTLWTILFVF